jgi:predicted transcriptional regulator of viral defense system
MSTSSLDIIEKLGGTIRTSDALKSGVSPRDLYKLRDDGSIINLSRGVYRISEMGLTSNPDLVAVACRAPEAVICLVSALSFHNLTTQIPYKISVAVAYGASVPNIDYPPVKVHRFKGDAFGTGIEEHDIEGIKVKVYNPEKTLADCFKFRGRLGKDIILESIKLYWERRKPDIGKLLKYAKVCRIEKAFFPYLESRL